MALFDQVFFLIVRWVVTVLGRRCLLQPAFRDSCVVHVCSVFSILPKPSRVPCMPFLFSPWFSCFWMLSYLLLAFDLFSTRYICLINILLVHAFLACICTLPYGTFPCVLLAPSFMSPSTLSVFIFVPHTSYSRINCMYLQRWCSKDEAITVITQSSFSV